MDIGFASSSAVSVRSDAARGGGTSSSTKDSFSMRWRFADPTKPIVGSHHQLNVAYHLALQGRIRHGDAVRIG